MTPQAGHRPRTLDELSHHAPGVRPNLARDGMPMTVVTHEIGFAREVADALVFVDDGVVVEAVHPKDVLTAPQHRRTQAFLPKVP
jgi:polar amino acid transport system ATP-binding protein